MDAVAPPAVADDLGLSAPAPRYAGFWERVVALSIDFAAISGVSNLVTLPLLPFTLTQAPRGAPPSNATWWVPFLIGLLYFGYFWSGLGGSRTWGMRVLGLRVVKEDGAGLSVTRAVIRWVGFGLSCAVAFIGVIWAAFDPRKQGWHDKLAGSVVIGAARAEFPEHPVRLAVAPPAHPVRFWAFPVFGAFVKFIALTPVFFMLFFVAFAVVALVLVIWIPVLLLGTYPSFARRFFAWSILWSARVNAFLYGLTDRYPWPGGGADHPVQLAITATSTSARGWAVPVLGLIAKVIVMFPAYALLNFIQTGTGVILLIAWAPVLFTGSYPAWASGVLIQYMRWGARTSAFLIGITDTYPRTWHWEQ